jgi:hypothetical protein
MRTGAWSIVVIGLALPCLPSIAGAVGQEPVPSPSAALEEPTLDDLGKLYREGQPDRALAIVARWQRDKGEAETNRLRSAGGASAEERERSLRAGALILAERGVLDAGADDLGRARWELRSAWRLVAELGDATSARFAGRFYLLASLALHAVADIGAAHAIAAKGLERFKTDPELLLAEGAIAERAATLRRYEAPPGMPLWRRPAAGPAAADAISKFLRGTPSADGCFAIEGVPGSHDCLPPQSLGHAQSQYSLALDRDPGLVEARLRLGRVLLLQHDPRSALASLDKVTSGATLPSQLHLARLFEGQAREELGDLTGAVSAYEAAVKVDPEGQAALIALGRALNLVGERARSQEAFALALRPSRSLDPWCAYLAGQPHRVTPLLQELRELVR